MRDSRISRQRSKFRGQIRVLDSLQLSAGIPADTKKFENWQWVDTESTYVTSVRNNADKYMDIIESQRRCPGEIKDQMKLLIADFMNYDHGKLNAHRLLDKIALNGTLEDCEALGIKRSTPLAKTPSHGAGNETVSKVKPTLALRLNEIGKHILTVRNPATLNSAALPEGVSRARLYRFIGTTAPTSLSQFESIGNAKRGIFECLYNDIQPGEDRLFAFYICRYEDTHGETWEASDELKVEIYFPAV